MKVKITFETVNHNDDESYEVENGWTEEEGIEFESVDEVVEFLNDEGAFMPSNSHFNQGTWYSTEGEINYRNGDITTYSYHLYGFTEEQEEEIFFQITP